VTTWLDRKDATKTATDAVQEVVRRAIEEPGFVMTRAKLSLLLADVVKHAKLDGWHQAIGEAADLVDIIEHRHSVILEDEDGSRVATECLTAVAKLRDKEPV
jgi:hypothetical protein